MADRKTQQRGSVVDRPLSKGKSEVNISTFALLFSEMVSYCQNRVGSVPELQSKLSEMGQHVGVRILDLLFIREKGFKRETKLLNILLFIKSNVWKVLFGKEADKLEHANDDERTYYIIEKESLVNYFISVPKDKVFFCLRESSGLMSISIFGKHGGGENVLALVPQEGSLNCAAFTAGIVESILSGCNFPAKVTAHWHKGTTFMIKFEDSVLARDKALEQR